MDTSQTQKVGNTRINVENVNGEVKIRHLNQLIPCVEFPIISKIIRIGFLLQNFKKDIIQRRDASNSASKKGRPCRGAVRWCGRTDDGLVNIRGEVHCWGIKCEIEHHAQLSAMPENRGKSREEISDMVLDHRWDLIKRKEIYAQLGIKYDGGDL